MYYSEIVFASDKKVFGKIVIYSSLKTVFFSTKVCSESDWKKKAFYSAIL